MKNRLSITRRDFINGVSYGLAASVAPIDCLRANGIDIENYPPALTGIRGNHPGSNDFAHRLAFNGPSFLNDYTDTKEVYDLIVVGGGISGLSAAYFYQKRSKKKNLKILIIDNHDDFGGHAKRNEFNVDGKTVITYGGSQSIESPGSYEKVSRDLLLELGIDFERFYTAYDFNYFSDRGLKKGVYFNANAYGESQIVKNMPGDKFELDYKESIKEENLRKVIDALRFSSSGKEDFIRIFTDQTDYLSDMTMEEKYSKLISISYNDYLQEYMGFGSEIIDFYQDRLWGLWGVGTASISAFGCWVDGLPGFEGLGFIDQNTGELHPYILSKMSKNSTSEEPYIFHFPDGNATVARLLVRKMLPNAIPGSTMDDIVTAQVDYNQLDLPDQNTRIRLNSTVLETKNVDGGVEVLYGTDEQLYKIRSKQCVLACDHRVTKYICPELPKAQKEALANNVRTPLVWVQVAMRNWKMLYKNGVYRLYCPQAFFNRIMADFPVSIGDVRYPQTEDEPVVLWLTHCSAFPNQGLTNKEQFMKARKRILEISYQEFEDLILDHLAGAFGSDFKVEDVAGITINRWAHGYAYEYNELFDGDFDDYEGPNMPHVIARKGIGNIAIANSDSRGYAYVDGAISMADRAVNELL